MSRRYRIACALALASLVAAYANHFENAFHFDDDHTIENNIYIRDLRNIPLFFRNPQTFSSLPANQSYRPLLSTTLALDYRVGGGLNPRAFHVTSFALFTAQCIALLFLYRLVMDNARAHAWNQWAALAAAALYAVHAANAETVNYIIQRGEILSTLGIVLAVLLFARGGRARRFGLYLIPAAAGVLGKEQGVMAAPMIFLYVALFERQLSLFDLLRPRHFMRVLRDTWPAFAVCIAIVAIGMRLSTTFTPGGTSRWAYLITQPFVLWHYAWTFVLPVGLSADTDWKPIANPFDARVVMGLVFIACAIWAAVAAARRRETRPIAFGILWFFVTLIPSSSIVPFAEVMNDHRMFLPFVGLTLAAVWAVALALMNRQRAIVARPWALLAIAAACVALLVAHAYGTWQRNVVWRTEESLWLDVTKKSPENGRGLMTYGVIRMAKGDYDTADQYFTRALQYTPNYAYLHVNIGVLKGARGQHAEAERHFRNAQQYDPANPVSYYFYARWLNSVGRTEEARLFAQRTVELSPGHVEGLQLLRELEARPAPVMASEALETRTPEQWLELSLAKYRAGRYQECVDDSRRALLLRPDYAEAFNNICAAENAMGHHAEAVAACERALAIRPDFPLARNNLALAKAKVPTEPPRQPLLR
jgi:Flp pilus assembly protein TadD